MILDADGIELPQVEPFLSMRDRKVYFYLAGSRYIGGAHEGSDWDFIMQDTPYNRKLLKTLGFSDDIMPEEYRQARIEEGSQTTACFQFDWTNPEDDWINKPPYTNITLPVRVSVPNAKVQVCLCKDVQVQRTVRDIIKDHFFAVHLAMKGNTGERSHLWNALAAVVEDPAGKQKPKPELVTSVGGEDDDLPF